MFKLIKKLQLVILASFVSMVAVWAQATPYLYYEPYQDWTVVTTMKGRARNMVMEIDSEQVTHVLFAMKTAQSGDNLYYTNDSCGSFAEPKLFYNAPGGFVHLASAIDPQDVIHLVWRDATYYTSLYYAKISNGQAAGYQVVYDGGQARDFNFTVDHLGEVHICFNLRTEEGVKLAYIRSIAGVFQPLRTTFFWPSHHEVYHQPQICVSHDGIVYFFSFDLRLSMIKFINDDFESPVQLGTIECEAGENQRVVVDANDTLALFFTEQNSGKLVYVKSDNGITFSDPYFLTLTRETGLYYRYVSEPQVYKDGSLTVVTYHATEEPWVYLEGYYQLNRGYGFGNPSFIGDLGFSDYSSNMTAPQFRLACNNVLRVLSTRIYWSAEFNDYKTELWMLDYPPRSVTEPWIYIHPLEDDFDIELDRFASMRVTLDVYNPTDQILNVDLVMATSFSILPDVYYFLSATPSYPSFQPGYYGFPAVISAGVWWQNVEVFGMDLHVFGVEIPSFYWYWYAAMVDKTTGELVGVLSTGRTAYIQ